MTTMQTLSHPAPAFDAVATFTHSVSMETIPTNVVQTAKLLILDLIGVLIAGRKMEAGEIACRYAARHWAAGANAPVARLLLDGRPTSLPGFTFAMATQLDALDAHDGWQPSKGHAGAALLPALIAFAEDQNHVSGHDALVAMVLGYEISYRAAAALHATVEDYHTSGAWNALGCAAVGARLRGSSHMVLRNALGIAEYHGPRSQMMREIANPTMLHDGSGWGAPTGVYALLIAEDGFTGGPTATVEFDDAAMFWNDLGQNWLTAQQYIKPYPICRWSHAPIDCALQLKHQHRLEAEMIERVDISTFIYAAELNGDVPTTSPMAQYSLAWPVAAALARGQVGVDEILPESFSDPVLVELTGKIRATAADEFEENYPEKRTASISIKLKDGRMIECGPREASGGPDPQPTQAEVISKFRAFAGTVLPEDRVQTIEEAVLALDRPDADFKALIELLVAPPAG